MRHLTMARRRWESLAARRHALAKNLDRYRERRAHGRLVSTAFFGVGDFVRRVAIQICPEKRVRLGQREVKFGQALSAQA